MNNRNGNRRHRRGYDRDVGQKRTVNVPDGVRALAMVYGIPQSWRGIDRTECGFNRGTIFNELDKPFYGDNCKRGYK